MIIDSHIHLWKREMIPNEAIRSYMAPLVKFQEEFGKLLDFGLTEEKAFADFHIPVDDLLEILDMNKIGKAVILATDFELLNDTQMGTREYLEILFQECSCDDRLLPFISVDPNRGEEGLRLIEEMVKKYAPKGIKMYPATGFFPNEEKFDKYWNLIDDLGLVVTSHAGMALPPLDEKYCRPIFLERVAENHPELKIIVAHLGGKFYDDLLPLMERCDNIYTDCSALQGWLPSEPGQVYYKLNQVAEKFPERIVFGSDFPLYEIRFSTMQFIKMIKEGSWASSKVKDDLLGNNMAKVLEL